LLIIIKRFWFIFFVVPIFAEEDVPAFKAIQALCMDVGDYEPCMGSPLSEFTIRGKLGSEADDERWWWDSDSTLGFSNFDKGSKKSGAFKIVPRYGYRIKIKFQFETNGDRNFLTNIFSKITMEKEGILEVGDDYFIALLNGGDELSVDIDDEWGNIPSFRLKSKGKIIAESEAKDDSIDDECFLTLLEYDKVGLMGAYDSAGEKNKIEVLNDELINLNSKIKDFEKNKVLISDHSYYKDQAAIYSAILSNYKVIQFVSDFSNYYRSFDDVFLENNMKKREAEGYKLFRNDDGLIQVLDNFRNEFSKADVDGLDFSNQEFIDYLKLINEKENFFMNLESWVHQYIGTEIEINNRLKDIIKVRKEEELILARKEEEAKAIELARIKRLEQAAELARLAKIAMARKEEARIAEIARKEEARIAEMARLVKIEKELGVIKIYDHYVFKKNTAKNKNLLLPVYKISIKKQWLDKQKGYEDDWASEGYIYRAGFEILKKPADLYYIKTITLKPSKDYPVNYSFYRMLENEKLVSRKNPVFWVLHPNISHDPPQGNGSYRKNWWKKDADKFSEYFEYNNDGRLRIHFTSTKKKINPLPLDVQLKFMTGGGTKTGFGMREPLTHGIVFSSLDKVKEFIEIDSLIYKYKNDIKIKKKTNYLLSLEGRAMYLMANPKTLKELGDSEKSDMLLTEFNNIEQSLKKQLGIKLEDYINVIEKKCYSTAEFDTTGYLNALLKTNNPTRADEMYIRSQFQYSNTSCSDVPSTRKLPTKIKTRSKRPTWNEVVKYYGGYQKIAENNISEDNLKKGDFDLTINIPTVQLSNTSGNCYFNVNFSGNLDFHGIQSKKLNVSAKYFYKEPNISDLFKEKKLKFGIKLTEKNKWIEQKDVLTLDGPLEQIVIDNYMNTITIMIKNEISVNEFKSLPSVKKEIEKIKKG
jgi:hypothetical protein